MIGVDGGVWFCRRSDFQAVGGYNEQVKVGEDVRLLLALKGLGRKRQPRERLGTRFTARKLGLQPPYAINSARKFDKHGDWHMLRDALKLIPSMLFRRSAAEQYIDRYWYNDR